MKHSKNHCHRGISMTGKTNVDSHRPSLIAELNRWDARSKLSWCRRKLCQDPFEPPFHDRSFAICLCNASRLTRGTVVGRPWAHCRSNSAVLFNHKATQHTFLLAQEKRVKVWNKLTWKHNEVCFSSSTIREHSEGSNGSPNMIAPKEKEKKNNNLIRVEFSCSEKKRNTDLLATLQPNNEYNKHLY